MNQQTLLDALNIKELLPEEQEELLVELSELIFKGTLVRMLEVMDEDAKEKFEKLLEGEPDEEIIQAFLEEHVPQADSLVEETVRELRDDILAVTGESQD